MTQTVEVDGVIIGGGIAGLWLFNQMKALGYQVILLEKEGLGGWQSINCQGIIHGGIKYTLQGKLTQASNAIQDMPNRWKAALAGQGKINLGQAKKLSDAHYMWSKGKLTSRLATFFASKAVRGRMEPIKDRNELPEAFKSDDFDGTLYALNEIVLDISSVAEALSSPWDSGIYQVDCEREVNFHFTSDGSIDALTISRGDDRIRVNTRQVILTAGEGNEAMVRHCGLSTPLMQRRPLHMVLAKHPFPHPVYAHCVGTGSTPLATITSHPASDGGWVWSIGGNIAETGMDRTSSEQIEVARQLLAKIMPWIDHQGARWATWTIDRAEPAQTGMLRPDSAFMERHQNIQVCWPTKLALAPNLADVVIEAVQDQGIKPGQTADLSPLDGLPRPACRKTIWEELLAG